MPQHELTADRGDAGRRLDLVLSATWRDWRRRRARASSAGSPMPVAVNGAAARRVSRHIAVGDRVTVALPADVLGEPMAAESAPVAVCYEDEHLLVVDKAPGVVCHPTHAHAAGTRDQTRCCGAHASGRPGSGRRWSDAPTSGPPGSRRLRRPRACTRSCTHAGLARQREGVRLASFMAR